MAKKKKPEETSSYKSATCGVGFAVDTANKWDAEGYDVKWCFPISTLVEGEHVQAIYMLGKKRGT